MNIQLFQGAVDDLPRFTPPAPEPFNADKELDEAVRLLTAARSPGIFTGWGAVDVADGIARIADILGAPVSTTLQGLSAFPADHPLHTGMGFSNAAVPAAENAFRDCDCMLATGVSFGEIPTGSFGCRVPANLIQIDISPAAVGRNYPVKVGIVGDSRMAVPELLRRLEAAKTDQGVRRSEVAARIAADKKAYRDEWHAHKTDRVNPALFFEEQIANTPVELPSLLQGIGKLIVVDISLDRQHENPQLIFESLNSTGMELRQSDLIRNLVLMRLPEQVQTKLYETYWSKIESLFRGSDDAFDAAYGLLGANGVVSENGGSSGPSEPYTASVDTCRQRNADRSSSGRSLHHPRTHSSSANVPTTFVSMKAAGPRIERSTCVSAAKCTT